MAEGGITVGDKSWHTLSPPRGRFPCLEAQCDIFFRRRGVFGPGVAGQTWADNIVTITTTTRSTHTAPSQRPNRHLRRSRTALHLARSRDQRSSRGNSRSSSHLIPAPDHLFCSIDNGPHCLVMSAANTAMPPFPPRPASTLANSAYAAQALIRAAFDRIEDRGSSVKTSVISA